MLSEMLQKGVIVISDPSEKMHVDRSAQPALQQTTTREHKATTKHVVELN